MSQVSCFKISTSWNLKLETPPSEALAALLGLQRAFLSLRPVGTVFDPFAKHADLVFREADVLSRHHLGMRAATLHGADEQAAAWVAGQNVFATAGAAFEGRGLAGEIQRGRWQAAVVTGKAVLLEHRLDLGEEVMFATRIGTGNEGAGGDDKQRDEFKETHTRRVTEDSGHGYAEIVQKWAAA